MNKVQKLLPHNKNIQFSIDEIILIEAQLLLIRSIVKVYEKMLNAVSQKGFKKRKKIFRNIQYKIELMIRLIALIKVMYYHYYSMKYQFLDNKSCNKSCGPSDYYKGGKCDKNGCYNVVLLIR